LPFLRIFSKKTFETSEMEQHIIDTNAGKQLSLAATDNYGVEKMNNI
jgi:hypothetical protein